MGRDQLSRLLVGARISLVVGLAATTLNVVVATLIGGTSGFLGGKLDLAVQRFVDAWMAFPGLLLLLTIVSIAPPLAFFGFAAPPCRPVRVWPTGNPRVTLGRVRSEIQRRCGVLVRTQKAVAWSDRAGRRAMLGCRVSSSSMASSAVQTRTESGDGARQPAVPTDREHGEKSENSCAYPLTRFSVPISARHGPWRPLRLSENDSASVDAAARR